MRSNFNFEENHMQVVEGSPASDEKKENGIESMDRFCLVGMESFDKQEWLKDLNEGWRNPAALDDRLRNLGKQFEQMDPESGEFGKLSKRFNRIGSRRTVAERFKKCEEGVDSDDRITRAEAIDRSYEEVAIMIHEVDKWVQFAKEQGIEYTTEEIQNAKMQFSYLLMKAGKGVSDLWEINEQFNKLLLERWEVSRGEETENRRLMLRKMAKDQINFMIALVPLVKNESEYGDLERVFNRVVRLNEALIKMRLDYLQTKQIEYLEKKEKIKAEISRLDILRSKGKTRVSMFSAKSIDSRMSQLEKNLRLFTDGIDKMEIEQDDLREEKNIIYVLPSYTDSFDEFKKGEVSPKKDNEFMWGMDQTDSLASYEMAQSFEPPILSEEDLVQARPEEEELVQEEPVQEESVQEESVQEEPLQEEPDRLIELKKKVNSFTERAKNYAHSFSNAFKARQSAVDEFVAGDRESALDKLKSALSSKEFFTTVKYREILVSTIRESQEFMIDYYSDLLTEKRTPVQQEIDLLQDLDRGMHEHYFCFQSYDIYRVELDYIEHIISGDNDLFEQFSDESRDLFQRISRTIIEEVRCFMKQASFDDEDPGALQERVNYTAGLNQLERYLEWRNMMPALKSDVEAIKKAEREISLDKPDEFWQQLKNLRDTFTERVQTNTLAGRIKISSRLPQTFSQLPSFVEAAQKNADVSHVDEAHRPIALRARFIAEWKQLLSLTKEDPNFINKEMKLLEILDELVKAIDDFRKSEDSPFERYRSEFQFLINIVNEYFSFNGNGNISLESSNKILYDELTDLWQTSKHDFRKLGALDYKISIYLNMYSDQRSESYDKLKSLYSEVHSGIDLEGHQDRLLRQIETVKNMREGIYHVARQNVPFAIESAKRKLQVMASDVQKCISNYSSLPERARNLPQIIDAALKGEFAELDEDHWPYEMVEKIIEMSEEMNTVQSMLLWRFDLRKDLLASLKDAEMYLISNRDNDSDRFFSERNERINKADRVLFNTLIDYFEGKDQQMYMNELHRAIYEHGQTEKIRIMPYTEKGQRKEVTIETHDWKQYREGINDLIEEIEMFLRFNSNNNEALKNMLAEVKRDEYVPNKRFLNDSLLNIIEREEMLIKQRESLRKDQIAGAARAARSIPTGASAVRERKESQNVEYSSADTWDAIEVLKSQSGKSDNIALADTMELADQEISSAETIPPIIADQLPNTPPPQENRLFNFL